MKKIILVTLLLVSNVCLLHGRLSAQARATEITGILGAFGAEVALIHDKIEDKKEITLQNLRFTEGNLNGRHVVLAQTGMGKVNAAITTTLMLVHFKPHEILFTGIAGGVDPKLVPGDIVIGSKVAYHDYGAITPDSMAHKPTHNPVDNSLNPFYFKCDDKLIALAQNVSSKLVLTKIGSISRVPKIVTGIIVTGDVFVSSDAATIKLHSEMNAEATEMEGAAVGQTCFQQSVPFLVIRSLSDSASNNAHEDVAAFYGVAAQNSAMMVMAVLGKLNK